MAADMDHPPVRDDQMRCADVANIGSRIRIEHEEVGDLAAFDRPASHRHSGRGRAIAGHCDDRTARELPAQDRARSRARPALRRPSWAIPRVTTCSLKALEIEAG
jgi:hypothetical protein